MSSVVLATAGYDHTIRFWEATNGACYRSIQYPDSQVNKLEITTDKTNIAAAGNPQIRVFDVNSSDPAPLSTFDGHVGNVTAVGFQKDTKWMYSGTRAAPPLGEGRGADVCGEGEGGSCMGLCEAGAACVDKRRSRRSV